MTCLHHTGLYCTRHCSWLEACRGCRSSKACCCNESWLVETSCCMCQQSRRWIEDIASAWPFRRVIPAHFAAPVAATPQDLRCMLPLIQSHMRLQNRPQPASWCMPLSEMQHA